ncbi:MAG: hypothetical protein LUB61_04750 [Eggerthellaceae bacterium]|nr:hypothetical protein [Eggerthellaceae bacterium]
MHGALWRIEESFKITISTEKHNEAHLLICYIALTIIRLMQMAAKDKYGAQKLVDALRCELASALSDEDLYHTKYRSEALEDLYHTIGEPLPPEYMKRSDIKRLFGKSVHAKILEPSIAQPKK